MRGVRHVLVSGDFKKENVYRSLPFNVLTPIPSRLYTIHMYM